MLKDSLKRILNTLHIDITQNQKYDRQTIEIMKQVISPGSSCIDVGCHKGELLDAMIELSPKGCHFAFEPIPLFFKHLKGKYGNQKNVKILPYALCDKNGTTTFNYVVNAPAYSGIMQRKYEITDPQIEQIEVETRLLDHVIPEGQKIDFIKIDVEGGEYGVIKGAVNTIKESKPYIIFECGLGASEFYGHKPEDIFALVESTGLKISLMNDYLRQKKHLSKEGFCKNYTEKLNYYFLAHP